MEHKGITITFNEGSGKFIATDKNGQRVVAASLAAIKKQLDKAESPENWNALVWKRYGSGYDEVVVVGIKSPRKYGSAEWKLNNGETRSMVYPDTPENRVALDAFFALKLRQREEAKKLSDRHDEDTEIARALIVERRP